MRLLWTLGKVLLGLVLIVPVAMIVLATMLWLLGTVLGLTISRRCIQCWRRRRDRLGRVPAVQGPLRLILAESARGDVAAVAAKGPPLRSGDA